MPASDLDVSLRIRADAQRAVNQLRRMGAGLDSIDRRGRRAERSLRGMVRTAGRLAAVYLGFRAVVGVFRAVVSATEKQQQAIAQVERGLRNLEGQTGLTSQALQEHAAALQEVTVHGDEAILGLQALLLTFRNIDESNFNRVVAASLDLAAALGQAPRDAALQLGKALEDPVQGLTALRRSGTVFSREQTQVIRDLAETNRLAEAQGLILAEVERQYRGAARAQRETVGGAGAALGNAFGDLLEQRDGAEDLRLSIEGLTAAVKDPGFASAVRGFTELLTDFLSSAVDAVAFVVKGIGDIDEVLTRRTEPELVRDLASGRLEPADAQAVAARAAEGDEEILAAARAEIENLREARDEARPRLIEQLRQELAAFDAGTVAGRFATPGGAMLSAEETARQRAALAERLALAEASAAEFARRIARLNALLTLAEPNVPAGFTLPGPLAITRPAPAPAPAGAEQAAGRLGAIRAGAEDAAARLALSEREQANRRLALALDEIDRLEAAGGDTETALAARAAARQRHALEIAAIAEREAVRETEITLAALARQDEARRESARAHADALASIEAREIDLGIIGEYEAATIAAERWRAATLADLDEAAEGYADLRARVESAYAAMIAAADEARDEQAGAARGWQDAIRAGLAALKGDAQERFDQIRGATLTTFGAMEAALAEFVTSGKFSFQDFANFVIGQLARIAIRQSIIAPLADALGLVLHRGGTVGALGGARRAVPAAAFIGAPRFHAGGVAGLRADEVPVIAQRGETILPRGAQIAAPAIEINFENRGTPQRETAREVRFDPRGIVVSIVTDDLRRGGPIRQTMAREMGGRP